MGVAYNPKIVKDSLVLHLDAANKKSYPAGSIYFDGSGDYLSVTNNSAFTFISDDFTVEMWIKTTNTEQYFVQKGGRANVYFSHWAISTNSAGKVFAQLGNTSVLNRNTILGTTSVNDNNWHHIAFVRYGSVIKLFVDGNQEGGNINITATLQDSIDGLTIGSYYDSTSSVQGYINDLRITKGVARYNSNFVPLQTIEHLTDPYKSSVSFLLKATGGIKDYSDNRFPITIVGNTTVSTQTNVTTWTDLSGKGNNGTLTNGPIFDSNKLGSIVFDGVNDYADCGTGLNLNNSTICLWVNFASLSNCVLLTKGNWNTNEASYGISYYANKLRIDTFLSNTIYGTATYDITPELNIWYNVVFVFNSTNLAYKIYLNGSSVALSSASAYQIPRTSSYSVNIGRNTDGALNFNGKISNVLIYNKEISAQEVLQNFNAFRGRYGV